MKPFVAFFLFALLAIAIAPSSAQMGMVGVKVTQYPKEVRPSEKITFTWEVSGSGNITHTAVHWGNKTGVEGQRFYGWVEFIKDYARIDPPAKAPKTFTGSITAPSTPGTIYFRGHAIVDGKHYWTEEMTIKVQAAIPTPTPTATPMRPTEYTAGQDNTLLYIAVAAVILAVVALALRRRKKAEAK